MKVDIKALLERIFFGPRVKGEPVGSGKTITTIPGLVQKPTEKEWMKEFKAGSQYSRFIKQGTWYEQATENYDNMLKRIVTGSL
jgi:hypothetical protein